MQIRLSFVHAPWRRCQWLRRRVILPAHSHTGSPPFDRQGWANNLPPLPPPHCLPTTFFACVLVLRFVVSEAAVAVASAAPAALAVAATSAAVGV